MSPNDLVVLINQIISSHKLGFVWLIFYTQSYNKFLVSITRCLLNCQILGYKLYEKKAVKNVK